MLNTRLFYAPLRLHTCHSARLPCDTVFLCMHHCTNAHALAQVCCAEKSARVFARLSITSQQMLALIQERKTTAKHEKRANPRHQQKDQKLHQRKIRTRHEKIQKIMEEVKGTRNISSMRVLIPNVKNKEGETIKTRQGIATVFFAKFYEDLYEGEDGDTGKGTDSRTVEDGKDLDLESQNSIPEFTVNEIQDAIDRLKK